MALPSVLKFFGTFVGGNDYIGETKEVVLPKLTRKLEKWRSGGMDGAISMDLGQGDLEIEVTYGGFMRELLRDYAADKHDAVMIRWAGSYQRGDSEDADAVEVVVRGRHEEFDFGSGKPGEETEFKVKSAISYYKLTVNDVVVVEIDLVGMVCIVDGKDRLAKHRRNIGMN
ncbi:major tail tube protein [Chitinimonas prasina]|uniref:Major tail tube protein n=1 Tax=Chitinimonas prasina TaxID=1434937 RepID=A0ABQ5YFK8_9NEIS|nr:phage major tail tube protein [Chitinimonas prasina]GLR13273.1 major tail tube protein [Chitinimonas prasina]